MIVDPLPRAALWQKYLSCVALALPVSYPVMGWQTTGKASATRTKSVEKCFTALPFGARMRRIVGLGFVL